MPDLDEIQKRLPQIACPICKKSRFVIPPRAEQSFAESIYTARCADCNYTFKVSLSTKPIEQNDPDTAQWLGGLSCPSCEGRGAQMDFRCMPSVRDCFYFVTCKSCRHPYYEKAPMEAFE
jgi:hypothetical protein